MNYIKQLQQQVEDLQQQRARASGDVQALLEHLHGPKFTGFEEGGRRKDWIATGDVIEWLRTVRGHLLP